MTSQNPKKRPSLETWREKFSKIDVQTIQDYLIHKTHPIVKYIIVGAILIPLLVIGIYRTLSGTPIAVEREYAKTNDNYYNFTVHKQYKVGDDLYSLISYTEEDGWYMSQWNQKEKLEFNRKMMQNNITIDHPVAIGQVLEYFDSIQEPVNHLAVIDSNTLEVNGHTITGEFYNTQMMELTIDGDEKDVDHYYNVLFQQKGQLDLLNKYHIRVDEIELNDVDPNGAVEFLFGDKAWQLKTYHEPEERVVLKWMDYTGH